MHMQTYMNECFITLHTCKNTTLLLTYLRVIKSQNSYCTRPNNKIINTATAIKSWSTRSANPNKLFAVLQLTVISHTGVMGRSCFLEKGVLDLSRHRHILFTGEASGG